MRLTFRQGIARYQTDVYATPTFLQKSTQNGEFIDLLVSPDPTVIIFAHRTATYVVEETKTVSRAWGPFTAGQTANRYLYWDVNLLDASLTRGYTVFPQIVNLSEPSNPAVDQHWFDTSINEMKVWNGSKWVEKVRVFAATYSSQAIIQPYPLGTQVGINGDFDAGSLILDSYGKPVRQSDGTFMTTATELSIVNAGTKQFNFEGELISGMADEFIPKFSFVQALPNRRVALARSTNWRSRIVGLVTEDLYKSEVGVVMTNGLIRNEQWSFPDVSVGRPVFCGPTGEVTLVPPLQGVCQIAGYVFDKDSLHLNIQEVTILDDFTLPGAPLPIVPVADFYASPTIGPTPLTVHFTSTSLNGPTSYAWDVGNNLLIDSTAQSFSYTFVTPGKYTVRLRVMNTNGSDSIIKTDVVTVTGAAQVVPADDEAVIPPSPDQGQAPDFNPGDKTNLNIQLSAALQVSQGQKFSVSVTTSNEGHRTATNVLRTVVIEDMGAYPITITAAPNGTITKVVDKTLQVSFPVIPLLNSGQHVVASFTVNTPSAVGTIKLRAGVASPEVDSEYGDNTTELSVKVK
jgi:PKD repeat protein